jgi:GNAT superfamily N-acetyltransferase
MTHSQRIGIQLSGYVPGAIGKITELHATYYHEHWGFDASFETQVGRELSEFISRFHEDVDGFWMASVEGTFAGAIAIDGHQTQGKGARLRWFIVAPEFQNRGVGGLLIREAVDFCKQAGHKSLHLWTFEGLDAARTLYEREGFWLSEEHRVEQWGAKLKEQKFEMNL